MPVFRAEFHVHTVLSPCAEIEMLPPLIVQQAIDRGLDWIAITDHNASANVRAVQQAAKGTPLTVSPGMELQTSEEVHLLCLFDTCEQLDAWQTQVDALMPGTLNDPDHLGEQLVVDETGEFLRREPRLLITSARIDLDTAIEQVHALGGLAIPAHVDRKVWGLLGVLGFVPDGLAADALETTARYTPEAALKAFPVLSGYPLLTGGDAHMLEQIRGLNSFNIHSRTMAELKLALKREGDRSYEVLDQNSIRI